MKANSKSDKTNQPKGVAYIVHRLHWVNNTQLKGETYAEYLIRVYGYDPRKK